MKNIKNKKIYFYLGLFLLILFFGFVGNSEARTYYLDANNGNDEGEGDSLSPWKTLLKAQAESQSGDFIYLYPGDYGAYVEENYPNRSDFITYQALERSSVHFDYINISSNEIADVFLRFVGLNIKPDWVDPCNSGLVGCEDPQYPESTQSTYAKTATPFYAEKVRNIQLINSVIEGQDKYLTTSGVYARSSESIIISNCDISNITHGVRFIETGANNSVLNCDIHNLAGTGINTLGLNYSNLIYENNHIYDGLHPATLDYYPKAEGANVHGSGISIRDGNTTVRGNIIHDTGTSSGIMLYQDDVGNDYVNENVLIENNLIYDIGNSYILRIYEAGPNIIVRNNTFIAQNRYEEVSDGYYQYGTAFVVHSRDIQNGESSIAVYNNIIIGIAGLGWPDILENNNIVWSYSSNNGWLCTGDSNIGETTYVFTCTYADRSSEPLFLLFSSEPNMTFENNHGLTLNFSPTPALVEDYPFEGEGIGFQYLGDLSFPLKPLGLSVL